MIKLFAESRSPILARELEVERAQAINQLLQRPIAILPGKVGDPIRPFSRGLFKDIRALLKPDQNVSALRRATAAYVYSKLYYFASAQPDSMRYAIDGSIVEPVSQDDRISAQRQFLDLRKRHAENRGEKPPVLSSGQKPPQAASSRGTGE